MDNTDSNTKIMNMENNKPYSNTFTNPEHDLLLNNRSPRQYIRSPQNTPFFKYFQRS